MNTLLDIENWLTEKIIEESGLTLAQIDKNEDIKNLNLDSLSSITIAFDIENTFNIEEINPTVFDEFNTIHKLSKWIVEQIQ